MKIEKKWTRDTIKRDRDWNRCFREDDIDQPDFNGNPFKIKDVICVLAAEEGSFFDSPWVAVFLLEDSRFIYLKSEQACDEHSSEAWATTAAWSFNTFQELLSHLSEEEQSSRLDLKYWIEGLAEVLQDSLLLNKDDAVHQILEEAGELQYETLTTWEECEPAKEQIKELLGYTPGKWPDTLSSIAIQYDIWRGFFISLRVKSHIPLEQVDVPNKIGNVHIVKKHWKGAYAA